MKKLKIHTKWVYLRYKNRMKNSYGGKRELDANEKLIKNVVVKIASNPKNSILVSPISNRVHIQTEDKNYAVILSENRVKIANHKIFIETSLDPFFCKMLYNIAFKYVEKYRQAVDKTTSENEINGLNSILNQLN
jgi:uncharacterized protein YifN (PemK superfamily)